jgi:D-glycero-alpha-D-manno-heptose-7-phosphate kinase
VLIRSKAPLRISFGGGGTDVMPYLAERGGVVLSATIDRYAYGSMRTSEGSSITIRSLDYGTSVSHDSPTPLPYDGSLDLAKAVVNRALGIAPESSLDILLKSDAPPGSGLGSSSALVVALIGLFREWRRLPLSDYDVADLAYHVERVDMGLAGGKQDQFAATFGGINLIEFDSPGSTIVTPLRIKPEILNELQLNLLLCFTQKTRESAQIIETQVGNYIDKRDDVLTAMDELKAITVQLKNALLRGKLNDFGSLLHDAWMNKKRMADAISNPYLDELYEAARSSGALGGKVSGAGGGGFMMFYVPFERQPDVAESLRRLGVELSMFSFERNGLQTWRS